MTTHVRAGAAAVLLFALATGCTQVTDGTVAMTTEPGPPLTTTTTPRAAPDLRIPGLPRRTGSPTPQVPAPPNALTMTCAEYNELDGPTQMAVVQATIAEDDNPFGLLGPEVAKPLADTMCEFMLDATVKQVLFGVG